MNKIYINITNRCNYSCPFCCMYSSPDGNIFIPFDKYKEIVDENIASSPDSLIIQLEGGEPTLHPNLFLFLEYAANLDGVDRIVVDTNGKTLDAIIDKIIEIAERNRKYITVKPSINTYMMSMDKGMLKRCDLLASACEFLEHFDMEFNIRYRNDNDLTLLKEHLKDLLTRDYFRYSLHQFNAYGRMEGSTECPPVKITPTYDNWSIYSCDGICFGQDLEARSEHERLLTTHK